jgi:hypothetical protein
MSLSARSPNWRLTVVLMSLAGAGAILLTTFAAKYVMLQLRVAFAEDQIATFETAKHFVEREHQPSRVAAELSYVMHYYPCGTKQLTGTHLDRIVETARSNSVATILTRLRTLTRQDLGEDPERWLAAYGSK